MKNILDRYMTQIVLTPLHSSEETTLIGYFETPGEFREMVRRIGREIQEPGTFEYYIQQFPHKKPLIESRTLEVLKTGEVALNDDQFNLKTEQGVESFVSKHFNAPCLESPAHYWIEICLEYDNLSEKPLIIGYFSAINEFYDIVASAGMKIADSGDISFHIVEAKTHKLISSRIYKMKANAEVCLPDDSQHYVNMRSEADLKQLCFFLWENDFE